jgi:hypothetical protein
MTASNVLKSIDRGNPYDAIKFLKVIAKLDLAGLNVLTELPGYAIFKPYHELARELAAIKGLCIEALQAASPDLDRIPREQRERAAKTIDRLIHELDKELQEESELKKWLEKGSISIVQLEKAWTYSQIELRKAFEVAQRLLQDDQTIQASYKRIHDAMRQGQYEDTEQTIRALFSRRLEVKRVLEQIMKNAYKSTFTFRHNLKRWVELLKTIEHHPSQNIQSLSSVREKLLRIGIFAKGNMELARIRPLVERLVALSTHLRKVERAMEIAEERIREAGITDEHRLKAYWEKRIQEGLVYHGTSSVFLENIKLMGLTSEGIGSEGSPFSPQEYQHFLQIIRSAYGPDEPALRYFTQDVTRGFFLDSNYKSAVNYARQGPERIRFMQEHIDEMWSNFNKGKFGGMVSQQNIHDLDQISRKYRRILSEHKPIVLSIRLTSPALLAVLQQNGLSSIARMITDYDYLKTSILQHLGAANDRTKQMGEERLHMSLAYYLQTFDPIEQYLHNRPLKGTIPWHSIANVTHV